MRNLKVAEKLNEHGITFERLANGDGRFSVNIMVDGQRVHRTIGTESDGTTRTQVEEFIQKAKQEAKTGRLNLPKGRKLTLTFAEAGEKYLIRLEAEGGKNLKYKKQQFELRLKQFFGDKALNKINSSDIEHYKKSRVDAGAKPSTINRDLATISHIFNKASDWKWIEARPATIKRLKEERSRIIYLTVEQINKLLDKAKQDSNPHIYPFVLVGLETSMHRAEILSIKLEHIDLNRRVIYIPQAKAGAREQPITARLVQYLADLLKNTDPKQIWLFPATNSKTGHVVAIEKAFRRVVKAAGMNPKEVVRHTLRHTAITHLVQAGIDLPTVQRISGHKTLQMVVRYSHQNGEHIQAAMDKLEQRYNLSK